MEDYAYYRARAKNTAWRNSIRHNLTMHKSFIKVPRAQGDSGKGGYWRVDEAIAREEIAFEPKPVAQEGSKKKKKKKKKVKKEDGMGGTADSDASFNGGSQLMPINMTFAAPAGHGNPSISSNGEPSPPFTYPGQDLGSSPLYAASAELDDVFEDIEQEFGRQSANPVSPPISPGMPSIITEELDESALLRKMAAQLGNDQPQNNKLGASAGGGLPADLLGVSSAFQASVSGMFSGMSASFNGLQDKFSESYGGVSESFNQIFTWG